MQATVVIATYGRDDELIGTVRSLLADRSFPAELVVVDQSEHHSEPVKAELKALNESGAFAGSGWRPPRYQPPAISASPTPRGDVVVFVDDDVIVEPGFIRAHVQAHEEYPNVGAVAGRIREPGTLPTTELCSLSWLGTTTGGWTGRLRPRW